MIRIGDYVKLIYVYYNESEIERYANNTYRVVDIEQDGDILVLDKNFKNGYPNKLHISYAVLNIKAKRLNKIKSFLYD